MSKNLISINNLDYSISKNVKFRLKIKKFELNKSDSILIYGDSGTGKSTFLNLVSGALSPKKGKINVLGTEITNTSSSQKDVIRGDHFGIVFQTFNLLPYLSVKNNILLGKAYSKKKELKSNNEEVKILMDKLSLNYESLIERKAYELSIGQQQRVAVARALIGKPEIILADEPTSALDKNNQKEFINLLFKSLDDNEQGLIMVSHDNKLSEKFKTVKNINEICEINND
ncbi:MAG: ABC transporter ATP-binding protein YtrE [Alphaproteobacteria bacterium MarineAlpha9_Bin3]|nr:MAG: ABC transporter ATP-binding protein YtrE [Alphaproteobacteria bacterium MarineAlpha9_Bin3]|tara:strand:- start:603 stop:1289 length:687 start_codon:yes stop_codon:yes gene_type:complete